MQRGNYPKTQHLEQMLERPDERLSHPTVRTGLPRQVFTTRRETQQCTFRYGI